MRSLLWSSIDNDTSRDLDQAEVAERVNGGIRVMIAVADVDTDVPMGSPCRSACGQRDDFGLHGRPNFSDAAGGAFDGSDVAQRRRGSPGDCDRHAGGGRRNVSHRKASIARWYGIRRNSPITAWGRGWKAARPRRRWRHPPIWRLSSSCRTRPRRSCLTARLKVGALTIDREETEAVVADGQVQGIETRQKNRATDLIENFMVAANGVDGAHA